MKAMDHIKEYSKHRKNKFRNNMQGKGENKKRKRNKKSKRNKKVEGKCENYTNV